MSDIPPTPPERQGWRLATWSFIRTLRIFLLLVVLLLILVFSFTYFQQEAVQPATIGLARISLLSTRIALDSTQIQMNMERIQTLESQNAMGQKDMEDMLSKLDTIQQALQDQQITLSRLQQVDVQLQTMQTKQSIPVTGEGMAKASDLVYLEQQVKTLKVQVLISRARQYLDLENDSLASDQVQQARGILDSMSGQSSLNQQTILSQWIALLDMTLDHIATDPLIAANDLEIVWQSVNTGLPHPDFATATPSPKP